MDSKLFGDIKPGIELHPKYKWLRELDVYIGERMQLEQWFKGFIDRDKKIIKELQSTFHSSFWEIYLYAVFKEIGYTIDFEYNRPDFILKDEVNILVEATVANIKQNGPKEENRNLSNYLNMFNPPYMQPDFEYELNESIVRYSNSINQKLKKYKEEYRKCDWIYPENPFVIAVGSYSQVDYGREYIYGMLALLFGLYFLPEEDRYVQKEMIIKNDSSAEIPLGLFWDEDYCDISAIIFSCTTTLGKLTATIASKDKEYNINRVYNLYHDFRDTEIPYKLNIVTHTSPEVLSDGLFVFHNPNASNPISPEKFFSEGITHFCWDINEGLQIFGNLNPTVARLSIPIQFTSIYEETIFRQMEQYNRFSK